MFWKSKGFFIDMIMLAFHPLPYYDPIFTNKCIDISNKSKFINVEFHISTILLALMFLRIIFIVRSILNYSKFID